ncbi:hypothetical protein DFQ28_007529 [Apophysomyces sp. BC1034]|nr:hypothetical protein DFQ30_007110 [Apophysomyces sp. BC1015]KAG0176502.1 hypothetical protein DFQ29_006057 [Apophysomyces sp. BC1021]KAG0186628.1 hypothetical protein DFQ28_007529 [Apophysomyces sp. BC1034]
MADKYKNFKVKELQELLQKNGIPHTGKKEDLIDRLVKHDERKAFELEALEEEFGGSLDDFDESKLNLEELTEDPELRAFHTETKKLAQTEKKEEPVQEKVRTQQTEPLSPAAAAESSPAKNEQVEKGEPVVKEGSKFKYTPITFDKPAIAPKAEVNPAESPAEAPAEAPAKPKQDMTEVEKKVERAKRFGVQLDEKAKKELRAQRFGAPAQNGKAKAKPATTGLDPEVLKKRAERFGMPLNKEGGQKRGKEVLDTAEEEKKRKRAERFGTKPDNKKQKQ